MLIDTSQIPAAVGTILGAAGAAAIAAWRILGPMRRTVQGQKGESTIRDIVQETLALAAQQANARGAVESKLDRIHERLDGIEIKIAEQRHRIDSAMHLADSVLSLVAMQNFEAAVAAARAQCQQPERTSR